MFDKLDAFMQTVSSWFEKDIPDKRLQNDTGGRKWFVDTVGYSDPFLVEKLKKVLETDDLNKEFEERNRVDTVKDRKGISALQAEVASMYSMNTAFVQRYKGRMHYYRDDLSQKGRRNMTAVGQVMKLFKDFKTRMDS